MPHDEWDDSFTPTALSAIMRPEALTLAPSLMLRPPPLPLLSRMFPLAVRLTRLYGQKWKLKPNLKSSSSYSGDHRRNEALSTG